MTGQVRPEEPVLFSALSGRASVHLPGNPQVAATPGDQEVASISNIALQETRARALEKNAFRQQVAYILARQLQNRPLSAAQTELIWRVHEARTEVLKMLPLGRSNVKADYKACARKLLTS